FFHLYRDLRHLPSFPTRRSSDLTSVWRPRTSVGGREMSTRGSAPTLRSTSSVLVMSPCTSTPRTTCWSTVAGSTQARGRWRCRRSEEHTSELQSQSNLVCRLLLE